MAGWRATMKTVFATAVVTSAAWAIGGGLWLQQERARWASERAAPVLALREAVVAHAPVPARPVVKPRSRYVTMPGSARQT